MLINIPVVDLLDFLNAYIYNLIIAVSAMLVGCPIAYILGYGAAMANKNLYKSMKLVRSLFCNVPSFVLLFYFTLMVPSRLEIMGLVWSISPLSKAILALCIPVIGYFSELFERFIRGKSSLSLANFKQFFVVILMASSTASVIGVEEIMATANTYIAAKGDTSMMLEVYLIVALIFVISGMLIQALFYLIGLLYGVIERKYSLGKEDKSHENNSINPSV